MIQFIGIDFGTTACRTAAKIGTSIEIIENEFSNGNLPLIPNINNNESLSIEFMGLKQFFDYAKKIKHGSQEIDIPKISEKVFRKIKTDLSYKLKNDNLGAILVVPPYFSERDRSVFIDVCSKGGFEKIEIIDETAALMLGSGIIDTNYFLIYSLGAGRFYAALVEYRKGFPRIIDFKWSEKLSGLLFDYLIMSHLLKKYNIISLPISSNNFRRISEKLKIGLSESDNAEIDLKKVFKDIEIHNLPVSFEITSSTFNQLIQSFILETIKLTRELLQDNKISDEQITTMLVSGNSTRIPFVKNILLNEFSIEQKYIENESISKGAALFGEHLLTQQKNIEVNHTDEASSDNNSANAKIKKPDKLKRTTWLENFSPLFNNAEKEWNNQDFYKTVELLEQLNSQIGKFCSHVFHQIGGKIYSEEKFEKAIIILEKALKLDPGNEKILSTYHDACYMETERLRKLGYFHKAKEIVERELNIDPDYVDGRKYLKLIRKEIIQHFSSQAPNRPNTRNKNKSKRKRK